MACNLSYKSKSVPMWEPQCERNQSALPCSRVPLPLSGSGEALHQLRAAAAGARGEAGSGRVHGEAAGDTSGPHPCGADPVWYCTPTPPTPTGSGPSLSTPYEIPRALLPWSHSPFLSVTSRCCVSLLGLWPRLPSLSLRRDVVADNKC